MATNSRGTVGRWVRAVGIWTVAFGLLLILALAPSGPHFLKHQRSEAKPVSDSPAMPVDILRPEPTTPKASKPQPAAPLDQPPAVTQAMIPPSSNRKEALQAQRGSQEEQGGTFPPLSLTYPGFRFDEYLRSIAGLGGIFIADTGREALVARVDVTTDALISVKDGDLASLNLGRPRVISDPLTTNYLAAARQA